MKAIFKTQKFTALTFACVAAFICLTGASKLPYAVDFSGQWTLNESKSDLGQFGGRMAAAKMKITADAAGISIERAMTGMNGEATNTTDKLSFDGKETESAGFMNSKKKSTAKWSEDGKSLVVTSLMVFDRDGEKIEIKGNEQWKLGEDGKTLQISATSSSSFGENASKMVYDKAQ